MKILVSMRLVRCVGGAKMDGGARPLVLANGLRILCSQALRMHIVASILARGQERLVMAAKLISYRPVGLLCPELSAC